MLIHVAAATILLASAALFNSGVPSNGCSPDLQAAGLCGWISNPGDRVDVGGDQTYPGANGDNTSGGSGNPGTGGAAPLEPADPNPCSTPLCRSTYAVVSLPDVTLADLASFVPARPSLTGEPAGVGVVGMPANVIAAASEQQIPGELFDFEVVVRFVPSAYRFDYGDGTTQTSTTGGAAWSALGQAEFTPTATSHVYRSRGTFTGSVTVLYEASVDFGGGWRPVDGFVESTTTGYSIRVVEVHTALVDRTCLENRSGPGC